MSGKRPGKKKPNKSTSQKKADPEAARLKREARAKAAALREAEKRKQRRISLMKQIGVIAAVVLVAGAVVWGVAKARQLDPVAAPEGFNEDGVIAFGNPDADVTVSVLADYSCPHCRDFDASTRDLLASWEAGDEVRVEYHPIAFMGEGSERALNAAVCVVGQDPELWSPMNRLLFDNQGNFSDDSLIDLAVQAGAERDAVAGCIAERPHQDWIEYTTKREQRRSSWNGTPDVRVNGGRTQARTGSALEAIVQGELDK
ncbi:thioredoxin domain-containing protein [Nocardioides sp. AE5]|uniref:DsbA family protein n=1 Tax=Nocardioides sp. AE5 TaxID=2962573 RepID=UPI0028828E25|nr:thioredoxin domain-containing protein [Nocardioides sp. AE5]MDT0201639.1 thioredoxin domain-containing protein [Nocardioides sp. AE5]